MNAPKKELHWLDGPVKGWAEFLAPSKTSKDILVLKGKCPRCNHEVILTFVDETTTIGLNEYVGRVLGGDRPVPAPRKVTAFAIAAWRIQVPPTVKMAAARTADSP